MQSEFKFHHPLHLRRITEEKLYNNNSSKKPESIKSVFDLSSSDSIGFEITKEREKSHDPKRIRQEYTFTPRKKKKNLREDELIKKRRERRDNTLSSFQFHDKFCDPFIDSNDKKMTAREKFLSQNKGGMFVEGRNIVASSCSYVRPTRIENYEDKPRLNTKIPIKWRSAKQSVLVKRKEKSISEYLKDREMKMMVTNDDIREMSKLFQKIETKRRLALEQQTIPDWAQGSIGFIMTAPNKAKPSIHTKIISKNTLHDL